MTSGNYERYFEYEGRRYAHVLDPRTGYPATGTASVTVVHRDPVLADAAATALLVGGVDDFDALCARLGLEQALLITAGGDVRLTPALAARVHWLDGRTGPPADTAGHRRNRQGDAVSRIARRWTAPGERGTASRALRVTSA
ncbi:MAG: FAD:protein FMN transferase [Woeseiaceae bacterium]|nr:FAD:protein FMN transferase [Woeseiaceae bacterium]